MTLDEIKKSIVNLTTIGYEAGQNNRPPPSEDAVFLTALNLLMKDIEQIIKK